MDANVRIINQSGYNLWAKVTEEYSTELASEGLTSLGFAENFFFKVRHNPEKSEVVYVTVFYQQSDRDDKLVPITSQYGLRLRNGKGCLTITADCNVELKFGINSSTTRTMVKIRNQSDCPIWIAYDMNRKCLVTAAEELHKTKDKPEQILMAQKHDFIQIMPMKDFTCTPYGTNPNVFVSIFEDFADGLKCLILVKEYEKSKEIVVRDGKVTQEDVG